MKVVGRTKEHIAIVDGVFHMFASEGLPLTVVFMLCVQYRLIPSWLHFYKDAVDNGWSHKTIISRLTEALNDVYGLPYTDEVINRLNSIFLPLVGHDDRSTVVSKAHDGAAE